MKTNTSNNNKPKLSPTVLLCIPVALLIALIAFIVSPYVCAAFEWKYDITVLVVAIILFLCSLSLSLFFYKKRDEKGTAMLLLILFTFFFNIILQVNFIQWNFNYTQGTNGFIKSYHSLYLPNGDYVSYIHGYDGCYYKANSPAEPLIVKIEYYYSRNNSDISYFSDLKDGDKIKTAVTIYDYDGNEIKSFEEFSTYQESTKSEIHDNIIDTIKRKLRINDNIYLRHRI